MKETPDDRDPGGQGTAEIVAETIRLAAEAGLVGCSIEHASGNPGAPTFELRLTCNSAPNCALTATIPLTDQKIRP